LNYASDITFQKSVNLTQLELAIAGLLSHDDGSGLIIKREFIAAGGQYAAGTNSA
jgi:hypothetical protein